jgi:hypothetical protein
MISKIYFLYVAIFSRFLGKIIRKTLCLIKLYIQLNPVIYGKSGK